MIAKVIHLKNKLSKINNIKNDIVNLTNFKLNNDITYNLLNQQVNSSGYRLQSNY